MVYLRSGTAVLATALIALAASAHAQTTDLGFTDTLSSPATPLPGQPVTDTNTHLVITPTWDSTITSDPNAATIENTINTAIGVYEARYINPITVSIDFAETGSGLGESQTSLYTNTYQVYRTALIADKALGGDNTAFLQYLPASGNPVPGQSASGVEFTSAAGRALGFNTPGGVTVGSVNYDSQISLNMSIINESRTGPQTTGDYDLQSVVSHEIDEALGFNSDLDTGFPTGDVGPSDFFRYSANGVRSYDTLTTTESYFSTDGGATKIVYFNQQNSGDRHDWASSGDATDGAGVDGPPQVQDAFGIPNTAPNLGPSEFAALDVVGYNTSPVPEAASAVSFGLMLALGSLAIFARKRKASNPTD